jgi:hypothetical protein
MRESEARYLAGWSKQEFYVKPEGHAMHGYGGMNGNRAYATRTPLYARAVYLCEAESHRSIIYCCLDLAVISYALRSEVVRGLAAAQA